MKLYRVTVRRRSDGSLHHQSIYTKASSVHSAKGYWASRYTRATYEGLYDVSVETAFVTSWTDLDPNLERIEAAIEAMPKLTDEQALELVNRLNANLATKIAP